jgi:hypothetical protein
MRNAPSDETRYLDCSVWRTIARTMP